jgi:hypothetical protein
MTIVFGSRYGDAFHFIPLFLSSFFRVIYMILSEKPFVVNKKETLCERLETSVFQSMCVMTVRL